LRSDGDIACLAEHALAVGQQRSLVVLVVVHRGRVLVRTVRRSCWLQSPRRGVYIYTAAVHCCQECVRTAKYVHATVARPASTTVQLYWNSQHHVMRIITPIKCCICVFVKEVCRTPTHTRVATAGQPPTSSQT
jgi:hypothetical protein